jgi:O-antigen ligase
MAQLGLRERLENGVAQHQLNLMRLGVVAATLTVAAGLGYLAATARFNPAILVGAAAALLGGLLWYRVGRMEYAVLLIVLTANLLTPIVIPTGTQSTIPISLALSGACIGFWLFQNAVLRKPLNLQPSLVNAPIFAFAIVNVISYAWSNVFRDVLVWVWNSFPVVQLAALVVNILLPCLIILVAHKLNDIKWLKVLFWIVIALGVHAILTYFLRLPTQALIQRGSGGLFGTWVVALAFGMALFNEKAPWWQRLLLLVIVALWGYRLFILGRIWLSGWIPMMAACFVIVFLRSRPLFVALCAAAALYVTVNFDYYYQQVFVANRDEGGLQRLGLWQKNLTHVANHPLFGMGPAGYAVYNVTYHPEDARSTHNNYFDILAQTGVIGMAAFLWLLVAVCVEGVRLFWRLRNQKGFEAGLTAAVLGGWAAAILAMMLGDWVLPFAYNGTIAAFDHSSLTWIMAGSLIGLKHILASTDSKRSSVEPFTT